MKIGIMGYGNLGRGIECAIKQNPDMELAAVFSRRDPSTVKILTEGVKVYSVDDAVKMKDEIDVLILCGGSATDLPVQTPEYAKYFNVIVNRVRAGGIDREFSIGQPFKCFRDKVEIDGENPVSAVCQFSVTNAIGISGDHDTLFLITSLAG